MADYPTSIFVQRDIENVPGITFDATKKTHLYVEDLQALGNELAAIENILGLNVQGAFSTLVDRLINMSALIDGASLTIVPLTGIIDDSNTTFTIGETIQVLVINGLSYREFHGWTESAGTITIPFPVGVGGDIYGLK